jgi:hypothetical protein
MKVDGCGRETLIQTFAQCGVAEAAHGYEFPYGRGALTRFGVGVTSENVARAPFQPRRGALLRYDCYNRKRPTMTVEIRRCFF